MSSKEAEREEMKDETHELDDMEQDDLDEDDSKDEASWINECLFDNQRINKKIMQKKTRLKDNTKLSFRHKSFLYIERNLRAILWMQSCVHVLCPWLFAGP